MFRGLYNGSHKHIEDLTQVIKRAIANGVDKVFINLF